MAMSRRNMVFARALCFMLMWTCNTQRVSSSFISSVRKYSPIQFTSDPSINCPDNKIVRAKEGTRSAVVLFERITASDKDGRDISDRVRVFGQLPRGYRFPVGTTSLWFRVTDVDGNSESCSFYVHVSPSSCQHPPPSPHIRTNCTEFVRFGETCHFFCDQRYELLGPKHLVCRSNGHFDTYVPECQKKPNMPPTIRCPHSKIVHQEWGIKSAKVSWNPPTATDPEDGNISDRIQLMGNKEPGTRFPVGETPVQYTVSDSEGTADSCTFIVRVNVVKCDPIPLFSHLRSDCYGPVEYGKSCKLHCNKGYALTGRSTITCNGPNTFDSAFPKCQVKTCPKLPPHKGLREWRCSSGYNYDSTCLAICSKGYNVVDKHTRHPSRATSTTCQDNQTWSHVPVCTDVDQPVFTTCPGTIFAFTDRGSNTTVVASPKVEAVDNSGVIPSITQTAGPALDSAVVLGSHMLTFEARDKAGNKAECSVFVNIRNRYCKAPAIFDRRLDYNCDHPLFRHGSVCSFSCRLGIELKGSSEMSCEEKDGHMYWYQPAGTPSCLEKECGVPVNPPNARLSCDESPVGKVCSVECSSGYIRAKNVDLNLLVCPPATGIWTNVDHPGCVLPKHPRSVYKNAMVYWRSNCSGTEDVSGERTSLETYLSKKTHFKSCSACKLQDVKYRCQNSKGKRYRTISWKVSAPYDPKEGVEIHFSMLKITTTRQKNSLINNFDKLDIKDKTTSRKRFKLREGEVVCAVEHQNRGLQCAPCGDGYMFDGDRGCDRCPKDTYQDGSNSRHCSKCPVGTYTEGPGSSECKNPCPQGSSSKTGLVPCQDCQIGTYQKREKSTSCISCQTSYTTSSTGSKTHTDCYRPSDPVQNLEAVEFGQTFIGVQWNRPHRTNGALQAYDIHYQKESELSMDNNTIQVTMTTVNFNVTDLEPDTKYLISVYPITRRGKGTPSRISASTEPDSPTSMSTVTSAETTTVNPSEGSRTNSTLCPPGTESPDGTFGAVDACFPCGIGFYQDMAGQNHCRLCDPSTTTWYRGSRSKDDCVDRSLEKVTTTTSTTTTTTTPALTTPKANRCPKNTVSHTGFGPHCRRCGQNRISNLERTDCKWCPVRNKKFICPSDLEVFKRPLA